MSLPISVSQVDGITVESSSTQQFYSFKDSFPIGALPTSVTTEKLSIL
jgi:hypothetical protein